MKTERTRHKLDRGNALAISAIVLCFMITIGLAGLLNGGGFLSALSWNNEGITYYALSNGSYDNLVLARTNASVVRERGGAGFVLSKDGVYHLLLSTYRDKTEAEKVLAKQSAGSYLVELFVPSYDSSWCKADEKNVVNSAAGSFHTAISALYEIGNDLSEGELAVDDAANKLMVEIGKVEVAKTNLTNALTTVCDKRLNLESSINSMITLLNSLYNNRETASSFVSSIRYTSISLILISAGL